MLDVVAPFAFKGVAVGIVTAAVGVMQSACAVAPAEVPFADVLGRGAADVDSQSERQKQSLLRPKSTIPRHSSFSYDQVLLWTRYNFGEWRQDEPHGVGLHLSCGGARSKSLAHVSAQQMGGAHNFTTLNAMNWYFGEWMAGKRDGTGISIRPDPNYIVHYKHDSLKICNLGLHLSESMISIYKPAATSLHPIWRLLTDCERFHFASAKGFDVLRFARTNTRANAIDCTTALSSRHLQIQIRCIHVPLGRIH